MVSEARAIDHAKAVARVRVNSQGRIVIPAALRCALGIEAGDSVVISLAGDHLEILTNEALLERVWTRTEHMPHDGRVSESLIADRRAEAALEP